MAQKVYNSGIFVIVFLKSFYMKMTISLLYTVKKFIVFKGNPTALNDVC
jgi:hypothetical protein